MAWHRGELADAERLVREATVQWHNCGDRMDASDGIEFLGAIAAARERYTDAARLLAAANAARRLLLCLTPGFTASHGPAERALGQARHALGEDRFTQAQEEGQGLTLDEAVVSAARKGGGRKRPAAGWASLTPTELQVVGLVGEGLRNDAIARRTVHRARHRQGAPVPHLRQARRDHPRRACRTGSRARRDRQAI